MTGTSGPGSGGPVADGPAAMTEAAQLAVGVLAARDRNDRDGVEALLATFPSPDARAFGFMVVAELAVALLEASSDISRAELYRSLALDVEGALRFHTP